MNKREHTNDPDAVVVIQQEDYQKNWFFVIIGVTSQRNTQSGHLIYKTLPIQGDSYCEFAEKAFESIGCSPAVMREAHTRQNEQGRQKRKAELNRHDRRQRGSRPTY